MSRWEPTYPYNFTQLHFDNIEQQQNRTGKLFDREGVCVSECKQRVSHTENKPGILMGYNMVGHFVMFMIHESNI